MEDRIMNAKTWYVDPNGDGTADVYRGDTTDPLDTIDFVDRGPEDAAIEVMDAEVEKELPEASNAGNQGNSYGLSQRGGEMLKEMAVMNVVVGPPPSVQS
jgi:hypothetical protein